MADSSLAEALQQLGVLFTHLRVATRNRHLVTDFATVRDAVLANLASHYRDIEGIDDEALRNILKLMQTARATARRERKLKKRGALPAPEATEDTGIKDTSPKSPTVTQNRPPALGKWKNVCSAENLELSLQFQEMNHGRAEVREVLVSSDAFDAYESVETLRQIDAFKDIVRFGKRVQSRQSLDHVRWFFVALWARDLVRILNPSGSARIGPDMKRELQHYIAHDFVDEADASCAIDVDDLAALALVGDKLEIFWNEIGPASIFFLEKHLTDVFFAKYFNSNRAHREAAIAHLKASELPLKVNATHLNRLAQDVRKFLMSRFEAGGLEYMYHEGGSNSDASGATIGGGGAS